MIKDKKAFLYGSMNNQLFYMFMYFKVLCRFVFKNNIFQNQRKKKYA